MIIDEIGGATILVLAAIFVAARYVSARVDAARADIAAVRSAIDEQMRELQRQIDLLMRIDTQTMSEYEADRRRWEQMTDVTLDFVKSLQRGDTIDLVSRSYMYPFEKAATDRFEFRFETIGDIPTQFGFEVVGLERATPLDEWLPCKFFVSETEALTSTCEGSIRRRRTAEEILARTSRAGA